MNHRRPPAGEQRTEGENRIIWPQLVLMLGLLSYVGLAQLVQKVWLPGTAPLGSASTLVLVAIPALLWVAYFYLLDRYEPEPTHYVLSAFLLGALVAAPLSSWILHQLFTVDRWMRLSPFSAEHIAGSFLVVATTQELSKYLVLRYTIYLSDEFDEPADGIVYATATGIGFATALNFAQVRGGVILGIGALNITITTLAHACFAGAVGYAMGQAKFGPQDGRRQRTLALGLLAAIALNGAFYLLQTLAVRPAMELHPWRGLLLCGLFAMLVFGGVSLLMRRSLRQGVAPRPEEGA